MQRYNLFSDIPADLPAELQHCLCQGKNIRVERIVSRGHQSEPEFWYDQEEHEFLVLLSGAAGVRFADEPRERRLEPGDWLLIPPHRRHRVTWTAAGAVSVWLAVFYR